MHAAADARYRALLSRDPRFDGRFFIGVVTTGIYCRPICPAPTPKRENVRFYPCAAAAEEAGFRPCKRCRPETAPGTPGWLGTSASVSRALRLIGQGGLDDATLSDFAARLGMGPRHLTRLFREHLGTTPGAVARTRRTHFARKLVDETLLPMTEVAHQAGFASVRRFNDAVREAFGASPRELRRLALGRRTSRTSAPTARGAAQWPQGALRPSDLILRLPYRPPFDWEAFVGFVGPRAIPGVEQVVDGLYRRVLRIGETWAVIEARHDPESRCVWMAVDGAGERLIWQIVSRARQFFDLEADPLEIGSQLGRDPRMRSLVERRPGLRVPGAWDVFELAVRAVLGQQVSVRGATTLAGRVAEQFGTPLPEALQREGDDRLRFAFPEATSLARAPLERVGLTGARADTVRTLAKAVAAGELRLDGTDDLETVVEQLCRLPGVGPWTAQYIALRGLGEPDAFPAGDLGVRRALAVRGELSSVAQVERLAEPWRPWRSYATLHLWSSAADEGGRERASRKPAKKTRRRRRVLAAAD